MHGKKVSYNEWQKIKKGGRKTPLEIFLWCLFVLFVVLTVLRFFWENPVAGRVLSIMRRISVATLCVAGYFYFEKNSAGKVLSACSYFGCAVLLLSELFVPLIIVYKIRLYYHSVLCVLFLIRFIRWKERDEKRTPGFLGLVISATEAIRVMSYIERYDVLSRNFLIFIGWDAA